MNHNTTEEKDRYIARLEKLYADRQDGFAALEKILARKPHETIYEAARRAMASGTTKTTTTEHNTTTAAWTPGPWSAQGHEIYGETRYVGHAYDWSNPNCASEYGNINDNLRAEGEANARLMAAAPEMAEFIQAIVMHCDSPLADCVNVKNLGDRARAILARINGGNP